MEFLCNHIIDTNLHILSLLKCLLQDGYELLVDEFDAEERKKQEARQREVEQREQATREEQQSRSADAVAAEVVKAMAF